MFDWPFFNYIDIETNSKPALGFVDAETTGGFLSLFLLTTQKAAISVNISPSAKGHSEDITYSHLRSGALISSYDSEAENLSIPGFLVETLIASGLRLRLGPGSSILSSSI